MPISTLEQEDRAAESEEQEDRPKMFQRILKFMSHPAVTAILGALLGGYMAGQYSIKTTMKAHINELEKQETSQKKLVEAFLQAIHTEVDTLWQDYMEDIGNQLETLPDGEPLIMNYPLTQEYFTVYTNNASMIGHVPDSNLRRQIVTTYAKARGLIDLFRMNNDLIEKFERLSAFQQLSQEEWFKHSSEEARASLVECAKELKQSHLEIKLIVEELLSALPN